jgi:hypothetical protein
MNRILIKLIGLAFVIGCHDTSPGGTHFKTELIETDIYCEIFLVHAGGVHGGEKYTEYLTDSNSFRYFIGEYDDNSNISYEFKENDLILIRHINYNKVDGAVNIYRTDTMSKQEMTDSKVNLWDRKHSTSSGSSVREDRRDIKVIL